MWVKFKFLIHKHIMGQGSFNYNIANSQYEFPVYQYVIKEKLNSALTTWKNKSVTSKEIL